MLTLDSLRWAWHRVRANAGAAGGDDVSLAEFGRQRDAHLAALIEEVRAGTYRVGPSRVVDVTIRGHEWRLSILPVRDRVLQRAVLDALLPRLDRRFDPGSFGYRPGRGVPDAVRRVVELRNQGLDWVVDADIEDCFGRLDLGLLRDFVRRAVPDAGLRALIEGWIAPPRPAGRRPRQRGIPLGSPISPLLCNLYLDNLDRSLRRRGYEIVRYADDFVVLCKSERHAERALRAVEKVLRGLELELNREKTRVVGFAAGFVFLGVRFIGSDYVYKTEGKRIWVDQLPPEWFFYGPDDLYGPDDEPEAEGWSVW